MGKSSTGNLKGEKPKGKENTHPPVLIVEDEMDILESLKQILEISGHQVFTAANGLEGTKVLEQMPLPGVILLDLMMPVMDGHHFFNFLKEHPRFNTIPVVVISAFIQNGRHSLSAEAFIEKPINFHTLLNTVEKYCGKI